VALRSERRWGDARLLLHYLQLVWCFLHSYGQDRWCFRSMNHHVTQDCNSNTKYYHAVLSPLEGPGDFSRYCDSLRAGRSGDRILVGTIFSAPVQTCPEAHPASYTKGTGSLSGVKRPGRGVDRLPHLAPRLKEE
jgi:hypothetical protein